jgi:hypothetical protein
MSIKQKTSEIVFACHRPMVTGNSAAKDSAIAGAWRMSVVQSGHNAHAQSAGKLSRGLPAHCSKEIW